MNIIAKDDPSLASLNDPRSSLYNPSLYSQIETAINAAVQYYDHVFSNPVTFTVNFGWGTSDFYGNAMGLGEQADNVWAKAGQYDTSYSTLYAYYQSHLNFADGATAFNSLPSSDPTNGGTFRLSLPQAAALGLTSATIPADLYHVTLNSALSWTFDPNNRVSASAYDAVGVIEHEISEVMGRDGMLGGTTRFTTDHVWSLLDLFRYNQVWSSSAGHYVVQRALTAGDGWFSIDGQHLLMQYNNPINGDDATDWLHTWNGGNIGDAFGDAALKTGTGTFTPTGAAGEVSLIDMKEMNVIGWHQLWGSAGTTHDDFTGDGVSDILFRNDTTLDNVYFDLQGEYINNSGYKVVPAHDIGTLMMQPSEHLVGTGDFLGGGSTEHTNDLLFRNPVNGDVGFYHLLPVGTNDAFQGWFDLGARPGYDFAAVGNFSGHGNDEVLLRNNTTGDMGFLSANSNGSAAGWSPLGSFSTSYNVVGAGDFTGNLQDDILFRNNATGDMVFWQLDGVGVPHPHTIGVGITGPYSATSFSVVGVGDFNGDGKQDILFSSTTVHPGYLDVGIYDVSGGHWHDLGILSTKDCSVKAVGDYLGNGTSDILLYQASNGDTGYYAIKNFALDVSPITHSAWHDIGTFPTSYHIVS
jgi:hypothetical protein